MTEGLHEGRVAIVTGGGSGIGRAAAVLLGSEGARVCVADIDSANAESVAKEIGEAGGEAFACTIDVSREEDNARMVAETTSRYGALHLVHLTRAWPGSRASSTATSRSGTRSSPST